MCKTNLPLADVVMYVEDTVLCSASPTLAELRKDLQLQWRTIINWMKIRKMVMNVAKSTVVWQ